ncbi:hypothetical protein D3C79_968910 [compost metagenome]
MPQETAFCHQKQLLKRKADHQINQGKRNISLNKMLADAPQRLRFSRHLHHPKGKSERGILQQGNHQVGEYRNRDPQRLRQHNP